MQQVLRFHWVRFWIGGVAGLQVLGWGLSAMGHLGMAGYAIGVPPIVLAALLAAGFRTQPTGPADSDPDHSRPNRYFWRQPRFRRWLPRIFLLLAAGSLVAGLCHAPNNGDALGYRTPRVLNWLSAGHWHWIDALDARQNSRTVAYEWVSAPILALTASDRLLPLVSLVSYLLLPGLLFGLWRGLGISGRVSWWWMWLLPTGYGFAIQAGGVLTDLFGTVFSVAAVQLALEARQRQDAGAARFSLLAAALMVGNKASSLPLLLPWAVAIWPVIPLALRQKGALAITAALALVSSNLPTAVLNIRYCGDWTGLAAETRARAMIGHGSPATYLLHNAGLLLSQNFNPPILPMASRLNQWIETRLPAAWQDWLTKGAEDGVHSYRLRELPHEDFAGLGLPLSLLLGALLLARLLPCRPVVNPFPSPPPGPDWWLRGIVWSSWIAFLVYATQSGIITAARLLLPYYPLLMAGLLSAGVLKRWVRLPVWRWGCLAAALSTVFVCVASPMRPWFPAMTLLGKLDSSNRAPGSPKSKSNLERLKHAYQVCGERATGFDPFLAHVPAGVDRVGMVSQFQFLEAPLWRPYGSRRVIRPFGPLTPEAFRKRGVRYVVLRVDDLPMITGQDLEAWLREGQAEVLFRGVYCHFPVETGTEWVLVRLG